MSVRTSMDKCFLLYLPGELRTRIYFYLFAGERFELERQGFNTHMFPYTKRHKQKEYQSSRLNLLGVCRQIYAEAAFLPFTIGTIQIDNIETLGELPFRLTAAQCSAVRTLRVITPLGGSANIVKLFIRKSRKRKLWLRDYLPGARRVEIEVVRDYTQLHRRGISFLHRMRFDERRCQTKQWLTSGDGTEVEVIFSGYGICSNFVARADRQLWEDSCFCC